MRGLLLTITAFIFATGAFASGCVTTVTPETKSINTFADIRR